MKEEGPYSVDKAYAIKSNNFDTDITRDRDCFFLGKSIMVWWFSAECKESWLYFEKWTQWHLKHTPNFISSGSRIVKRLRQRQYGPVIIERTIGLVLGPSTAVYRPFLKHCTLTNKAVETIWRALSKPPQRRQGPDLCPLWLLIGTPSAIRPELASRRAEHSLPYSDVAKYILCPMLFVYSFLWHLRLVWLLVCCLYKENYLQIFKCVSFWLHGCCGEWEGGHVNRLTTPVGWLYLLQLTVLSRSAIDV